MSQFIHSAVTDMKQGRQTWRVFAALCVPAFCLSLALGFIPIH